MISDAECDKAGIQRIDQITQFSGLKTLPIGPERVKNKFCQRQMRIVVDHQKAIRFLMSGLTVSCENLTAQRYRAQHDGENSGKTQFS